MAIAGNKGEWSEIYVLLKLLGEGVVYAGDGNLEKIDNLYYPIINTSGICYLFSIENY